MPAKPICLWLVLVAGGASTALADADSDLDALLKLSLNDLVKMKMFGSVVSQRNSIVHKRDNFVITDVVGVDALGKLPDRNIAEAASRLPGLSVVRDQQTGEGHLLTIRGLDSGLNSYSINGVRMGSANASDRSISLNVLPPEGAKSIEIKKTLTPDMDGDALGGAVNITMPTAFDYEDSHFSLSVDTLLHDRSGETGQQLTGAFAKQLGTEKNIGVYFGAYLGDKDSVSQETENEGSWKPNNYTESESEPVDKRSFRMQGLGLDNFENRIKRTGFNFSLDVQVSDTDTVYLRGQHNEYEDTETHNYFDVKNSSTSRATCNGDNSFYSSCDDQGTWDPEGVVLNRGVSYEKLEKQTTTLTSGGETIRGKWSIDYALSYAYATEDQPFNYELNYQLLVNDGSTWLGNRGIQFSFPDVRYPQWQLNDAGSAAVYDLNTFQAQKADTDFSESENEKWIGQLNFNYRTQFRYLSSIKFGFKAMLSEHQQLEGDYASNDAVNGITLADNSFLVKGSEENFFDGEYRYGPLLDGETATDMIRSCDSRFFDPSGCAFGLRNIDESSNNKLDEDVYSAYLMGRWILPQGASKKWEIIAGARIEQTRVKSQYLRSLEVEGQVFDDSTNPTNARDASLADIPTELLPGTGSNDTRASESSSYTNLLPSISINYYPSDNFVYRGAIWTSVIRPEIQYIVGSESYSYEISNINLSAPVVSDLNISRSNLDLTPITAVNFDAGVEYYMGNSGLLAAALYHKKMNDFFLKNQATTSTRSNANGNNGETSVSDVRDAGEAEITGIELSYSQHFSFLPKPFDGLGLIANATFQDSEAETKMHDRTDKIPLVNAPEEIYNLAVYYEKSGWETRLSYQHTGLYLEDLRDNQVDKYIQASDFLDFTLSKLLPDYNLRVTFKAANLLEEHLYWATRGEINNFQKDYVENGRSFSLGVNWQH